MDEKAKGKASVEYECGPLQSVVTTDPGEFEGPICCGLCGTEMLVERGCNGPTSSLMGMMGKKRDYDFFHCPNREEGWHVQAAKLRELAQNCPSARIAEIYTDEANGIIRERKTTKPYSGWWMF